MIGVVHRSRLGRCLLVLGLSCGVAMAMVGLATAAGAGQPAPSRLASRDASSCSNDLPNWMTCLDKENPPGWATMPLNRMALPSSHDAQAYQLTPDYLWVQHDVHKADTEGKCGAYSPVFIPDRDAVVALARTQTADLREQLNRGVRVLDVRFAWPAYDFNLSSLGFKYDFFGAHGAMVRQPMNKQLEEVVSWARQHPRELVVVRLSLCGSKEQKPDSQAPRAEEELGISAKESGLCGVSGKFPATPADIHVASVTPGRNVLVYYHGFYNSKLEESSDLFQRAERFCGWQYEKDQFQIAYRGTTGSPYCAPGLHVAPPNPLHITQAEIRDEANAGIDRLRTEFASNNAPLLYQVSSDFQGVSMTWTPDAIPGVARFVAQVCPTTLIANNDLLRGIGYKDSTGIQTRADLFREFSRYTGIFMVDDVDTAFTKAVIALNLSRLNDSVSYAGLRGWLVNVRNRRCFDLPGGEDKVGARFQLFPCNGTNSENATLTENGELQVKRARSSECVDAQTVGDQSARIASLHPCNHLANQRWSLDTQGRIVGYGGRCLSGEKDQPLSLNACGEDNQDKWILVGTLRSTTARACLALPNAAGPMLGLLPCQPSDNQVILRAPSGRLQLQGKCIEGGPVASTPTLQPCRTTLDQVWSENEGRWSLPSRNVCIDTAGTGSGSVVRMDPCDQSSKWRLEG